MKEREGGGFEGEEGEGIYMYVERRKIDWPFRMGGCVAFASQAR